MKQIHVVHSPERVACTRFNIYSKNFIVYIACKNDEDAAAIAKHEYPHKVVTFLTNDIAAYTLYIANDLSVIFYYDSDQRYKEGCQPLSFYYNKITHVKFITGAIFAMRNFPICSKCCGRIHNHVLSQNNVAHVSCSEHVTKPVNLIDRITDNFQPCELVGNVTYIQSPLQVLDLNATGNIVLLSTAAKHI